MQPAITQAATAVALGCCPAASCGSYRQKCPFIPLSPIWAGIRNVCCSCCRKQCPREKREGTLVPILQMLSSAKSQCQNSGAPLLPGFVAFDLQAKVFSTQSEITFNKKPWQAHRILKSPGNGAAVFSAEEWRGLWHPDSEDCLEMLPLGGHGSFLLSQDSKKVGGVSRLFIERTPLPRTCCGVLILSSGVARALVVIMVPHVLGGDSHWRHVRLFCLSEEDGFLTLRPQRAVPRNMGCTDLRIVSRIPIFARCCKLPAETLCSFTCVERRRPTVWVCWRRGQNPPKSTLESAPRTASLLSRHVHGL